jgi:hypothetical protein
MARKSGSSAKPSVRAVLRRAGTPSPWTVAAERHRLRRQVRADREGRYRHYRNQAKEVARVRGRSLRILAEGDSWFDYPVPGGGGGVIEQLRKHYLPDTVALIANMAHAGDEVRQMLGLAQREELEKRLGEPDPDLHFDALLFSGGGDDLVGDQFCLWLRDGRPGAPPADLIDIARADAVLSVVQAGYLDLIAIRDRLSPNTKIFLHAYDFPKITGKGVCGRGPWLKPSLDYRGITDPGVQHQVVKTLLERFGAIVRSLEDPARNIFYVPTQGQLDPEKDWANEIHPTSFGFRKVARVFHAALKARFPQIP